jgi:ubiquitin-protein ligase
MNNVSKNRIMREFDDFPKNSEASDLLVTIVEGDIYHWKGILKGPEDTCYSGGSF